jgi:hypothetical protein
MGTSGLAIASLVSGILGFILWFPAILAVIFGHVAIRQIALRGQSGRGVAIAGLVLGYVVLLATVAFVLLVLVTRPVVQ